MTRPVPLSLIALLGLLSAGCQLPSGPDARPPELRLSLPAWQAPAPEVPVAPVALAPGPVSVSRAADNVPEPLPSATTDATRYVEGQVLSLTPLGEAPLADATIWTADGREAHSDANGRFRLSGEFPAGGMLSARHPGHVASTVVGLLNNGAIALHLQPRSGAAQASSARAEHPIRLSGQIANPAGSVADVAIALEDARGAFSIPVLTEADGRFEMLVYAPGRRVQDATLYAVSTDGPAFLALASGINAAVTVLSTTDPVTSEVTATEVTTDLDFEPATPATDPLTLVAATHTLRVNINAGAAGGNARTQVLLKGPSGAGVSLPGAPAAVRLAPLPQARYALDAEAQDAEAGTQSALYRDVLPIDFSSNETRIDEALLAPPALQAAPTLATGERLAWAPVPGASAYQVLLSDLGRGGLLWEGFSTDAALSLAMPALGAGSYGLTVAAWDEPGLSARTVASASFLRVLPFSRSYRKSTRFVRVTR